MSASQALEEILRPYNEEIEISNKVNQAGIMTKSLAINKSRRQLRIKAVILKCRQSKVKLVILTVCEGSIRQYSYGQLGRMPKTTKSKRSEATL